VDTLADPVRGIDHSGDRYASADEDDPLKLAAARAIFPQTVVGHDLMEIVF
jgi:hypothetical protein